MEKILKIEETSFSINTWDSHSGFQIITNKQIIKLGISNLQSCCETWGYFLSEDDISSFIGSKIKGIEIVDTELKTKIKDMFEYGLDSGDTLFVNIITTKGILQFVAYNAHNGYYGHHAVVISEQVTFDNYL